MPVLFSSEDLVHQRVPTVDQIRRAPLRIQGMLQKMQEQGDIVGATSYGSLFCGDVISCASDSDWLIIFSSTECMFQSRLWRTLQAEMKADLLDFHVPVLSVEHLRTGNHTISSLLHGIRRAQHRLIVGEDPLLLFQRYGWYQNSVLPTLQLFGSYTRFIFEAHAHIYEPHLELKALLHLMGNAIAVWKDILSTMLVRSIRPFATIPIRWDVYASHYNGLISAEEMRVGGTVATFLRLYRATMEEYDRLRHTGADLSGFVEDYAVFLEQHRQVIMASARFAEANIRLYREWATPMPLRRKSTSLSLQPA